MPHLKTLGSGCAGDVALLGLMYVHRHDEERVNGCVEEANGHRMVFQAGQRERLSDGMERTSGSQGWRMMRKFSILHQLDFPLASF